VTVEEESEYQRAATGYLVWPLAALQLLRESDQASRWTRIHSRQSLVFGMVASFAYLLLLAVPLIVVIAEPGLSSSVIVSVYAAGLVADVVIGLMVFGMTVAYSGRAARGELFEIPLVTAVATRIFPLE
jgi:uncharacterized membrane protein